MDITIQNITSMTHDIRTVIARIGSKFFVYTTTQAEMHSAFLLKQAYFHAEKIVALTLLEIRIAAFEQELPYFEKIVWIVFIRYSDWH